MDQPGWTCSSGQCTSPRRPSVPEIEYRHHFCTRRNDVYRRGDPQSVSTRPECLPQELVLRLGFAGAAGFGSEGKSRIRSDGARPWYEGHRDTWRMGLCGLTPLEESRRRMAIRPVCDKAGAASGTVFEGRTHSCAEEPGARAVPGNR